MSNSKVFYTVCELDEHDNWELVGELHGMRSCAEEELKNYPDGFVVCMTWTRCLPLEGQAGHPACGMA